MHIGFDGNDMPKFWKIHKIAIIERNLSAMKFVVEPMETITFDHHFQCYEVNLPVVEEMEIRDHKDFSCHIPKHICRPYGRRGGARFICARHEIGTNN